MQKASQQAPAQSERTVRVEAGIVNSGNVFGGLGKTAIIAGRRPFVQEQREQERVSSAWLLHGHCSLAGAVELSGQIANFSGEPHNRHSDADDVRIEVLS